MSQELKALVQREMDIFSQGDYSVADQIISPDYIGYDPATPEPIRGPEGVKEQAAGYRAAFSDLQLTIDHQVAEGEYVVTRWTARGTHDGELFGIPATGRSVTTTGISIERVVGDKVVEDHTVWDALGMMQQIGAVPAMA